MLAKPVSNVLERRAMAFSNVFELNSAAKQEWKIMYNHAIALISLILPNDARDKFPEMIHKSNKREQMA